MKKKLTFVFSLLFIAASVQSQEYLEMIDAGTFPVQEVIDAAETYFDGNDQGRGTGYKQFKRWEYNAQRLMNENGYLPTIQERLQELDDYNAYLNATANDRAVLMDNWQEKGPQDWNASTSWNPGVGRITGIAVDLTNNNHIIIGANTGGVWRTTDAGQTWTPLGDTFTNLRVYSVAIDPANSDTYFFGSSSGLIFKSTDAGATWNQIADLSSSLVNQIRIHPTNSDIMFASSQNAGIYRTIDGGTNWTEVAGETNAYDIEFKPGDTNIVYVTGRGFHKSTDGGATFTEIILGANGPKMIGVSPDDPTRVYVLEADGGSFGGFFRSDDSGDTFTELDHTGRNYFGYDPAGINSGGQAPRDMDIDVNPTDADEVHIAGVHTWRSANAGVDFELTSHWVPGQASSLNVGYCHADVDMIEFFGTTLYVGTDGGIFKAEDTGTIDADYYTDLTAGIGIRQFYKIGVSQTTDVVVTGGSQDNGSSFFTEANGWIDWIGADGMEGFVDKDTPDTMYGMIQFGGMYRTDNGANTLLNISGPGPGSGNWVTPFEQDPTVTNTIYCGYDKVYKSENKGSSWNDISQAFGGNLSHLKIAPSDNQMMYAARGALLYKTTDGGATNWSTITGPSGAINSIAIHPTNPDLIAMASTGANKVSVSRDAGDTWENYRFNLPNFSAIALVWDNNNKEGLYLGMDYGIYYIDNTFTEWQPYSNNLPNVIINELDINNTTNMLYAGSYGRGLWESPLVEDLILGVDDRIKASDVALIPNPATSEVNIVFPVSLEVDIRVYDITGKLMIYNRDVQVAGNYMMNVSSLVDGVYFIRLNSAQGTITKKLIKK